jgi:pyrroline-5-carboxylate reductase
MVKLTKEDPAILRQKVTSPGGTTQAALELMDREGMADIFKRAIHRSAERASELGAQLEKKG